ncbi:MAG TPA: dihydrodipicolinate synthase family protein [Bacillus sp. (in: firmicutes)]|uniref:dihydrodipicolinate synthase family protein n=1 Tax=Bacillus litorisediminis TaxID=2922713 RepID=UPI001FAEB883|nr:dihydrodipicolinate synthase family protein [Bacillus litorisediminis]HWO78210.1 dihydrodipicolinate synthase family protein [Bacillus sp. (in: firmicutes)]
MLKNGISVITLTPFDEEGNLDEKGIRNLTDFYINSGVHGMTILGIMGEVHKLSDQERLRVMNLVLEQTNGRVPVTVGCTAEGTKITKDLAKEAERAGAQAVMIAAPRNLNNEDMLFKHYAEIADSISLPIVIQDEPVTTGVKMSPQFIARLGNEIENVLYVKLEEAPTTVKITKILNETDQLKIYGGLGGMYFFEELDRGAAGIMTGFAFPEVLVKTFELFTNNQRETAREYFYKNLPLIRFEAQLGMGGVAIRKETFKLRGIIDSSHVRFPGASVDQRTMEELQEIIDFVGLTVK